MDQTDLTTLDKMRRGQPYFDSPGIKHRREMVRQTLISANQALETSSRISQIKPLFQTVGSDFFVEVGFKISLGLNTSIGDHFYANSDVQILDEGLVTIGDNVKIGPKVGIYTPIHPEKADERITGIETTGPVIIGNNVWIGGSAVILPGVALGNNVIVGAGAVVTKSFPDNVVIVGNPARVLKVVDN